MLLIFNALPNIVNSNDKREPRPGFAFDRTHLKTGTWEFADIDCRFISLHHLVKWYKFGITRSFDNLSVQIRYGMMTRAQAVAQIRQEGFQVPQGDVEAFCAFEGLPESWFWEVAESFRNQEVWKRDGGKWVIPDFLIEDWQW